MILERRAKDFQDTLNCPSTINEEAIAGLPQVTINSLADPKPKKNW